MAIVLDGKKLAGRIKAGIAEEIKGLPAHPVLAVLLVGDDPASATYVRGKEKDCEECDIISRTTHMDVTATQHDVIDWVYKMDQDEFVDGILVQLPLPKHIDEREVLRAIYTAKDVDCFNPTNVGRLMVGEDGLQPCTPSGVMELLHAYGIDPAGKHCVIVGRSNIVGKPLAMMMLHEDATVTVCHTKTNNLKEECLRADILVAAAGKAGLITAEMVKRGAVVIDVAMNRNEEGKLCGDVDYDRVFEKAAYITPVPGGIGPLTRAMLMKNTLKAFKDRCKFG